MNNEEIGKILSEIALYLDIQKVPFKPRAYEKASDLVRGIDVEMSDVFAKDGLKGLKALEGIGDAIAKKIVELLETGKLEYLEKLREEFPVDVMTLNAIEGIGPRHIETLYIELGVKNLQDLEKVVNEHRVCELEGFGEKSEVNILEGIEFAKKSRGRFPRDEITPIVEKYISYMKKVKGVERIEVAGSYRRQKKTIGDIDILILCKDVEKVMDAFVEFEDVAKVLAKGETKSMVKLENALDVDLRVVPKESFGAALMYFTGSKHNNVKLREIALKKNMTLNEYGLYEYKDGEKGKLLASETEEDVYEKLGVEFVRPEGREL